MKDLNDCKVLRKLLCKYFQLSQVDVSDVQKLKKQNKPYL